MRTPGRFPTTASINSGSTKSRGSRGRWSSSNLTIKLLIELFSTIHNTLSHVPYAICGLGALVDHGFTARRLTQVSILCPSYAKDNVRAWLAAKGYDTFGDSVGIPVGAPDAEDGGRRQVTRVRIKYLDEGFDRLQRVRSSLTEAWILGLASQLDHAAAGFVDHHRRLLQQQQHLAGTGSGGNGEEARANADNEERALRTIARDVLFCLDKAARTRQTLDPELLPSLLSEDFWVPFTARHEDARTEMARAGVDVAGVLARHRDDRAIREHEEMLRMFGSGNGGGGDGGDGDGEGNGGGVVEEQPRGFEGMRVLGDSNTKSVYSVASSTAAYAFDKDKDLPPVPPLPANLRSPRPKMRTIPERTTSVRSKDSGKSKDGGPTRSGSGRGAPRRDTSDAQDPEIEDGKGARSEWI